MSLFFEEIKHFVFPLSFFLLSLSAASAEAVARDGAQAENPIHWSAENTVWNRKTNRVELVGSAAVHQPGETITADAILLDLENRTVHAKGNAVYVGMDVVIQGEEMYFNLDTRTGSIVRGRVTNEKFALIGERINRLGPLRFQTYQGEYTTCLDCPHSWSVRSADVDMEIEGYAYMSNVTAKIKDTPFFWFPYLIVPLKTNRQTGLLFPKVGFWGEGFFYVQPFFWAINRYSDMTIAAGEFFNRGTRVEWEGRYQLSERSGGIFNFDFLRDTRFPVEIQGVAGADENVFGNSNRWEFAALQVQELPFGIEQKFRLLEVSDNLYPFIPFPGRAVRNEAFISSDLIFSYSTDQVSAFVGARRFRDLLYLESKEDFDPGTVQVAPQAVVTTKDQIILKKPYIAGGITLGATHFTRAAGPFDNNPYSRPDDCPPGEFPCLGFDPIREGTRFTIVPSLYTTIRPWEVLSLVPSVEYRSYFYSFPEPVPSLNRGYLLLQADLFTQLERIYRTDDPLIPRTKHIIRPMLSYSLIPLVNEPSDHPFIEQIAFARDNGFSGFQFDNNDIVPVDTSRVYNNYFLPLGHSLTYGFVTEWIRRKGAEEEPRPSYQKSLEISAGQTFNFRELRRDDPQPLSRLFSGVALNFDRYSGALRYFYDPYLPITDNQDRHYLSVSSRYTFAKALHQRVLLFERSIGASYVYNRKGTSNSISAVSGDLTFSINDYILPNAFVRYNFLSGDVLDVGGSVRFQSPSQCYSIELGARASLCAEKKDGLCGQGPNFNLLLNWTGEGFNTVGDVASSAVNN